MDLDNLKELLQILEEKQISEFELEEAGMKLRIRKAVASAVPTVASAAPASSAAASAPAGAGALAPAVAVTLTAPTAETVAAENGLVIVKSPIVGTFYRAPDPNAAPFVTVGDHVKVGQVLCIIEAMKLMNEIEAEAAGEIVRIHPENGQPVQYGEALFSLRPSR